MPQIQDIPVTEQLTPELKQYAAAMRDGFGESPLSDEGLRRWHKTLRADGTRLSVIHDERGFGLDGLPVATFASFPGTLNAGHEMLPTTCITDVTVLASHRRRGFMQQLLRKDLGEARERGDVFAALTATDTRIYGRFGFGVSTLFRRLELNTGAGFGLRTQPTGRTVFADPEAIVDLRRSLFERWHERQFFSLTRHQHYWSTGFDWDTQGTVAQRAAVHIGEDGEPDGAVIFSTKDDRLVIEDLFGLNAAAELDLIRLLAQVERIDIVEWLTCHDPRHPLAWALEDRRVMRVSREKDALWVRILDVERALAARKYDADGDATFRVTDPLDEVGGTYRVHVAEGRAVVERSNADASVTVSLEALAALYSGLATASELAAAGYIEGAGPELQAVERLFRLATPGISASLF